jgi:thiosulfate/3-mercaptopyruvate sulfurtransferase
MMTEPLVSPEWLAAHLDDPQVQPVDVRWYLTERGRGRAEYEVAHIPGASFLDVDDDLAAPRGQGPGRHPLPSPEAFAAALGAAGIPDGATVIAYDDARSVAASRLVWMLRSVGQDAAVLDGGLAAWAGPLEEGDVPASPVARRVVAWPVGRLASADEVAAAAAAGLVVDSRSAERYRGEQTPLDPRPGHVPGARSLPFDGNIGSDGRLADADELRARFASVEAGSGTIFYCGSGVTACVNLLAAEQVGLGPGRLYVGSWSGWASDPARPVARG